MTAFLEMIIRILGILPLSLRSSLGRSLGYILSFIPTKDRLVASLQQQIFLPKGSSSSPARVYMSLGQTLLECINLQPMLKNIDYYAACPNMDLISLSATGNRPVVALAAHTGNWDLMAAFMIQKGVPLSTIGREAREQSFQQILHKIRESYGIKTIWRTKSNGTAAVIKELKENCVVAALIDQDTRVTSVPVPFFDHPASSPSGLVALGKRYNALFLTAFNFRTSRNQYTIFVEELDSSGSVEDILTQYNSRLEHFIKQFPDQWVWIHKRWRTDQNGKRMSSSEYISYLTKKLNYEKL
jgi:Kdo2-lipid IVA lauroyltransferase/acyltransferase